MLSFVFPTKRLVWGWFVVGLGFFVFKISLRFPRETWSQVGLGLVWVLRAFTFPLIFQLKHLVWGWFGFSCFGLPDPLPRKPCLRLVWGWLGLSGLFLFL